MFFWCLSHVEPEHLEPDRKQAKFLQLVSRNISKPKQGGGQGKKCSGQRGKPCRWGRIPAQNVQDQPRWNSCTERARLARVEFQHRTCKTSPGGLGINLLEKSLCKNFIRKILRKLYKGIFLKFVPSNLLKKPPYKNFIGEIL